ncbi:PREDICTED: uncharacterized protein LOC106817282 isoform X2 [Priapulus caudatus]|uniref:Uncharacterized protein LOC106817282 isoform X2 n=1 Tax=Priapulus caudatus TaxID=37621 RepID=A0ABM1EZ06_PRICU|nr:PREDICTED: uncharacterized protein LOC106817282 isoform X2 [Priapulus caudatus]
MDQESLTATATIETTTEAYNVNPERCTAVMYETNVDQPEITISGHSEGHQGRENAMETSDTNEQDNESADDQMLDGNENQEIPKVDWKVTTVDTRFSSTSEDLSPDNSLDLPSVIVSVAPLSPKTIFRHTEKSGIHREGVVTANELEKTDSSCMTRIERSLEYERRRDIDEQCGTTTAIPQDTTMIEASHKNEGIRQCIEKHDKDGEKSDGSGMIKTMRDNKTKKDTGVNTVKNVRNVSGLADKRDFRKLRLADDTRAPLYSTDRSKLSSEKIQKTRSRHINEKRLEMQPSTENSVCNNRKSNVVSENFAYETAKTASSPMLKPTDIKLCVVNDEEAKEQVSHRKTSETTQLEGRVLENTVCVPSQKNRDDLHFDGGSVGERTVDVKISSLQQGKLVTVQAKDVAGEGLPNISKEEPICSTNTKIEKSNELQKARSKNAEGAECSSVNMSSKKGPEEKDIVQSKDTGDIYGHAALDQEQLNPTRCHAENPIQADSVKGIHENSSQEPVTVNENVGEQSVVQNIVMDTDKLYSNESLQKKSWDLNLTVTNTESINGSDCQQPTELSLCTELSDKSMSLPRASVIVSSSAVGKSNEGSSAQLKSEVSSVEVTEQIVSIIPSQSSLTCISPVAVTVTDMPATSDGKASIPNKAGEAPVRTRSNKDLFHETTGKELHSSQIAYENDQPSMTAAKTENVTTGGNVLSTHKSAGFNGGKPLTEPGVSKKLAGIIKPTTFPKSSANAENMVRAKSKTAAVASTGSSMTKPGLGSSGQPLITPTSKPVTTLPEATVSTFSPQLPSTVKPLHQLPVSQRLTPPVEPASSIGPGIVSLELHTEAAITKSMGLVEAQSCESELSEAPIAKQEPAVLASSEGENNKPRSLKRPLSRLPKKRKASEKLPTDSDVSTPKVMDSSPRKGIAGNSLNSIESGKTSKTDKQSVGISRVIETHAKVSKAKKKSSSCKKMGLSAAAKISIKQNDHSKEISTLGIVTSITSVSMKSELVQNGLEAVKSSKTEKLLEKPAGKRKDKEPAADLNKKTLSPEAPQDSVKKEHSQSESTNDVTSQPSAKRSHKSKTSQRRSSKQRSKLKEQVSKPKTPHVLSSVDMPTFEFTKDEQSQLLRSSDKDRARRPRDVLQHMPSSPVLKKSLFEKFAASLTEEQAEDSATSQEGDELPPPITEPAKTRGRRRPPAKPPKLHPMAPVERSTSAQASKPASTCGRLSDTIQRHLESHLSHAAAVESQQAVRVKRGRGRPKGSPNKKTILLALQGALSQKRTDLLKQQLANLPQSDSLSAVIASISNKLSQPVTPESSRAMQKLIRNVQRTGSISVNPSGTMPKRKRGRPRKEPLPEPHVVKARVSDKGDSELRSLVRSIESSIESQFSDKDDFDISRTSGAAPKSAKHNRSKAAVLHRRRLKHIFGKTLKLKKRRRRNQDVASVTDSQRADSVASICSESSEVQSSACKRSPVLGEYGSSATAAASFLERYRNANKAHLLAANAESAEAQARHKSLRLDDPSTMQAALLYRNKGKFEKDVLTKLRKRACKVKSKHKNIVDPVFLDELDDLTQLFDRATISDHSEPEQGSLGCSPPSVFRVCDYGSGKRVLAIFKRRVGRPRKAEMVTKHFNILTKESLISLKRVRKKKVQSENRYYAPTPRTTDPNEQRLPLKKRHKMLESSYSHAGSPRHHSANAESGRHLAGRLFQSFHGTFSDGGESSNLSVTPGDRPDTMARRRKSGLGAGSSQHCSSAMQSQQNKIMHDLWQQVRDRYDEYTSVDEVIDIVCGGPADLPLLEDAVGDPDKGATVDLNASKRENSPEPVLGAAQPRKRGPGRPRKSDPDAPSNRFHQYRLSAKQEQQRIMDAIMKQHERRERLRQKRTESERRKADAAAVVAAAAAASSSTLHDGKDLVRETIDDVISATVRGIALPRLSSPTRKRKHATTEGSSGRKRWRVPRKRLPGEIGETCSAGNTSGYVRELIDFSAHKYKKIKSNVYVDVKPLSWNEPQECTCRRPENPEVEKACGEQCLNRIMYTECSPDLCPCFDACANQRIQRHQWEVGLEKFYTEDRGHGIRTSLTIKEGDFILEYVGEVVSEQEFRRRMTEVYHNAPHHYCLNLDSGTYIDGYRYGAEGRFVNHSCDPNCEMQKWSVNGMYRMCLFALRNIEPGEELSYNYNFHDFNSDAKQECKCGSANCSGFLGGRIWPKLNGLLPRNLQPVSVIKNTKQRPGRKGSGRPSKSSQQQLSRRPMSFRERAYVLDHRCFLLRNVEKVKESCRLQALQPEGGERGSDGARDRKPNKADVFMAQFTALKTARSVKTRRLALAEGNTELTKTARLAQVFKDIFIVVSTEKSADNTVMAMPLFTLPSRKRNADFYEKIKDPICLNQIENKIMTGHYKTIAMFDQDMYKLFRNAQKYHGEDSAISRAVSRLQSVYQSAKLDSSTYFEDILGEEFHGAKTSRGRKNTKEGAYLENSDDGDIIRCLCNIYKDEGLMVQCEKCLKWQHADCMGVTGAEDNYMCELCSPRPCSKEVPMTPQPMYAMPGCIYYMTLMRDELQIRQGDCVYLLRERPPKAGTTPATPAAAVAPGGGDGIHHSPIFNPKALADCSPGSITATGSATHTYPTFRDIHEFDKSQVDIFRVEKLWKNDKGDKFVFGHHYYRPHETYHEPSRRFFPNEVFRVPLYEIIPLDSIVGVCCVMDLATYCRGCPVGMAANDCYICEYRLDKTARLFNKISRIRYPICTKSYAFNFFEKKLQPKRTYSPHEVPDDISVDVHARAQSLALAAKRSISNRPNSDDEDIPLAIVKQQSQEEKKAKKREHLNSHLTKLLLKLSNAKNPLDVTYLLETKRTREQTPAYRCATDKYP